MTYLNQIRIQFAYCRTAYRYGFNPDFRDGNVGFRLVFVPQLTCKAGWLLLNR